MIITKEHQEAMVNNYRKEGHNEFECMGFIDGMNQMFDLINKQKKPINNNFLKLIETIHQSLIDANLKDEQFNVIWSGLNESYSNFKI